MIEIAWLVEKKFYDGYRYLMVDEAGVFDWTIDHMQALRFSRNKDANAICYIVEDADRVSEHQWG